MSLPSLSLGSTPWATPHRYYPVGGGGRRSREDSLLSSLDEVMMKLLLVMKMVSFFLRLYRPPETDYKRISCLLAVVFRFL